MGRSTVFVPPPSGAKSPRTAQLSTAACAAALLGAADNAHADAIGDAAGKLSKAAYPFMKEVPWNSYLYSTNPGSKDAVAWAKAIGKMIDMEQPWTRSCSRRGPTPTMLPLVVCPPAVFAPRPS